MTTDLKAAVWTNWPNHYQQAFFEALRAAGVDLRVCYYRRVAADRIAGGWAAAESLPPGEQYVERNVGALGALDAWRERVHVVPGYGEPFLRELASTLSREQVRWVHWSEPAHPGLRWLLTYPVKRRYAGRVNRHALGAFGTGLMALRDFHRWGMHPERMAVLPYVCRSAETDEAPDEACARFAGERLAFLYLGTLERRKGIDILLRAFAAATGGSRNDGALILAGLDRSGGRYARLARHLGLEGKVLFRGAVPASAIPRVIKAAPILVLPSRFDGWGVVLNEAASAGRALIASNRVGAAYHLIAPSENGFRVEPGCVRSLARAMLAYLACPALAAAHGKVSRELVASFTPERNARRFVEALHSWTECA